MKFFSKNIPTCFKHVSILLMSSSGQSNSRACFFVKSSWCSGIFHWAVAAPLITIALWKRPTQSCKWCKMNFMRFYALKVSSSPLDIGETICRVTLMPPALYPIRVTEFGSPPNDFTCFFTQRKAITWSLKPLLPGASLVFVLKKPSKIKQNLFI